MKVQLLLVLAIFNFALGFEDYLLKDCAKSGFCHRNREYAKNIQETKNWYYKVEDNSIEYDEGSNEIRANIIKSLPDSYSNVVLPLKLGFIKSQNAKKNQTYFRLTIDEIRPKSAGSRLLKSNRYNLTSTWAFDPMKKWENGKISIEKGDSKNFKSSQIKRSPFYTITTGNNDDNLRVNLHLEPFRIEVFREDNLVLTANEDQFLNIEHYRRESDSEKQLLPEESDFNMFHDNFEYSKNDKIPFGPESIAIDLEFKSSKAVYGIPEHADSLKLKDTRTQEPYRLFNVDVFEYSLDSPTPTYGSIPFMFGTNNNYSAGVFWVNAADTWVDINYNYDDIRSHWISESGILDVIVFVGDSPSDVLDQYTDLTGKPFLPLESTIGYHQCRWNYNSEDDVLTVQDEMDKAHIPFDVIWLDLEYTEGRKYFTWKPSSFPNPKRLLEKLAPLGRQLVVLIDPHLRSKGNNISDTIVKEKAAVTDNSGKIYIGQCWPGESIWIDTMGKIGRKVWRSFFDNFFYKGLNNLQIWNDMNEPSIFNGPETTAPKDLIHADGYEERSIHNVYGLTVHQSTFEARTEFYKEDKWRPFILTRAFFAGSQRTAATWTGDNKATWDYLRISIPMCLTNNIAGFPFIGADVAGFSGDPEEQLVARWYQAGLWYPFFRAHAHLDTKRREPYLFKDPIRSIVKNAVSLRYRFLPTFYTSFYESSVNGTPIMKPMFFDYFGEDLVSSLDDQFFIGNSGILVKPITAKNVFETDVVFPPKIYYDLNTYEIVNDNLHEFTTKTVAAPLEKIPMFLEGGHVIFQKELYRRSSSLMKNDPYSILIAPDENGNAYGTLYIDDGTTLKHQDGQMYKFIIKMENYNISMMPEILPKENEYLGSTIINKISIIQDPKLKSLDALVFTNPANDASFSLNQNKEEPNVFTLDINLDMKKGWSLDLKSDMKVKKGNDALFPKLDTYLKKLF
ncbi:Glucosidase 2 subunit alpha [Nakaseomyces bracarensis]|uniref:Glucosidase II subunit alpha n=1 Tax=Nakaseomyces bracarensis TaxID=273131 RepID=A0ABR4NMX9_9SACH